MRLRCRPSSSISLVERCVSFRPGPCASSKERCSATGARARGDFEFLAHFLECELVRAAQAEAQADDLGFAFVERADHGVEIAFWFFSRKFSNGLTAFSSRRFRQKKPSRLIADGRIQRSRRTLTISDARLCRRNLQFARQLFVVGSRRTLSELHGGAAHLGILSTRCTGKRIVFDWLAKARLMIA